MSLFASRGVPNVSIACPGACIEQIGATMETDSLGYSPVANSAKQGNCGASVDVIVGIWPPFLEITVIVELRSTSS